MSVGIVVGGRLVRVDEGDAHLLFEQKWQIWRRVTNSGREYVYIRRRHGPMFHRVIMGAAKGQFVDHIDGDGLNNTRANLRLCTHAENMRNRRINVGHKIGIKGVTYRKKGGFRAAIKADGVAYTKQGFSTAEAAGAWYAEQSVRLHGAFASPTGFEQK